MLQFFFSFSNRIKANEAILVFAQQDVTFLIGPTADITRIHLLFFFFFFRSRSFAQPRSLTWALTTVCGQSQVKGPFESMRTGKGFCVYRQKVDIQFFNDHRRDHWLTYGSLPLRHFYLPVTCGVSSAHVHFHLTQSWQRQELSRLVQSVMYFSLSLSVSLCLCLSLS